MTKTELNRKYLAWMYQLICAGETRYFPSYRKLLRRLYELPFTYTMPMDGNRADDGVNLRYRFGEECGYSDAEVANALDDRDCSVLEMMLALAIRCEDNIMYDPDLGSRADRWFWVMLTNLNLANMSDRNYDQHVVDQAIANFLSRNYSRDGDGGLFRVRNCPRDMRTLDIWYQMCWYLNDISDDGSV